MKLLLDDVANGRLEADSALESLRDTLPYEDLGYAKVDHHRSIRRGFPEVIFGEGKTAEQIEGILQSIGRSGENVLITRLSAERADGLADKFPQGEYHAMARCWAWTQQPVKMKENCTIAICTAGTGDLPVAEEAAVTARLLGNRVETIYDIGVAGLHRLVSNGPQLGKARVIIAVAGMEGALPTVVAGLVRKPVIAVPTSIGYGAAFGGVAALLGMLNSCADGVSVVNIDNGYGAAVCASLIIRSGGA